MTPNEFPIDVPVPRPYHVEDPIISDAAIYRAWHERLDQMGLIDRSVPSAIRPYVRILRALQELTERRKAV